MGPGTPLSPITYLVPADSTSSQSKSTSPVDSCSRHLLSHQPTIKMGGGRSPIDPLLPREGDPTRVGWQGFLIKAEKSNKILIAPFSSSLGLCVAW